MHWAALRVFNDDIIQPQGGFGMHPHRDMEIVTYVVGRTTRTSRPSGQSRHHSSRRNSSHGAGKGIVHAEYNHSKENPVHLMQLWILPRKHGNTPRWEQKQFTPQQRPASFCRWFRPVMLPERWQSIRRPLFMCRAWPKGKQLSIRAVAADMVICLSLTEPWL